MLHTYNQTIQNDRSGIYYLRVGDSYYIGRTGRSFKERWNEHADDLVNNTHSNYKLQQAYASGLDIACGVLLYLETPRIIERAEEILIQYYKNRVNLLNLEGVTQNKYGEIKGETESVEGETENNTNIGISPLQRYSGMNDTVYNGQKSAISIVNEIVKRKKQGEYKSITIRDLFGISPGKSARYKRASAIYDKVVLVLDKQE